jgi:hypothetical protein
MNWMLHYANHQQMLNKGKSAVDEHLDQAPADASGALQAGKAAVVHHLADGGL